jgi:Protein CHLORORESPIRATORY REDUCTION 7
MAHTALMYDEEHFVFLQPGQAEQFLTAVEMVEMLKKWVTDYADDLPADLTRFTTIEAQVDYLFKTSCELDLGPGNSIQWFAVRLEK